jgi:predicted esterase
VSGTSDPHGEARVVTAGAPLSRARLALVMLHGRGASAADMLGLFDHLAVPDVAARAPEAAGNSWWPGSFLAPLADNEPGVTSTVAAVRRVLDGLAAEGFGPERVVLTGFSQGACLALETAARTGLPFRAVVALSGGLVGTADADGPPSEALYGHRPKRFDYTARLDRVPIFIGCHSRDPHIPLARVRRSEAVLTALGATVTTEIYPGAGHAVVAEEIRHLRSVLNGAAPGSGPGGGLA